MKTERLADVDKNVTKRAKKTAPKKPKKHFFKEVIAELKKVTWPTQKDVIKATGVVVAVVVSRPRHLALERVSGSCA